ncbi:MAG: hypothetical protein RR367_08960 [Clostridia bacterium]
MKRQKIRLRPLSASMNDLYTKRELLAICEAELFARAKHMDTALLTEALDALDDRADEEAAPHRADVWAKLCGQAKSCIRKPKQKIAVSLAFILLLIALAGMGLALALHAGVLTFPSVVFPWLPRADSDAAQSLVQSELFQAQYEHCELRVREAAFDGHQLRIVYSLRDTRAGATLTADDRQQSAIAAAQLDGIGCCDYLTLDGQDVYLEDTYQLPGEENAEMLYYLAANIPGEISLAQTVIVCMPIGEIDLQTGKRLQISFPLNTATVAARSAQKVGVVWDNLNVTVERAEFSPLHGLVVVRYAAVNPHQPFEPIELSLFTPDGDPVGQKWYSSYGGSAFVVDQITTQYIPEGSWPEHMVLAPQLVDGQMDQDHLLALDF